MPAPYPVLSPKEQMRYNIGVCLKAVILLRRGMAGYGRAVFQEIGVDMRKCLSLLIAMSRENNERIQQAFYAVMAICLGMAGWYANRLSDEVAKANEGITAVSVQVARVETRVDGIEKRLDTRVAFEPSKSDMMVAATR